MVKYTKQEIKAASKTVMKSLGPHTKHKKSRVSPLGKRTISKSAHRRQNRQKRQMLAGKPMEELLEALETPEPPKKKVDPSKNTKANLRVTKLEVGRHRQLGSLNMAQIKERLGAHAASFD